jgi:PAS domain S-box-containing protein
MSMQTKTQRKKATSGVTVKPSKTVRSPVRGDGGESKVSKSKQLLLDDKQYRDLFDSTSDLIQSVAPDGRILYTNKAWRDVLGYSEKEVAHLKIWDIISPESMDHCMELFKRVMAGEHVGDIEAVFVTKDGSRIDVEGNAHCRFVEGKPAGTQGFFRDVTERKQAEEALRQSEERYRTVLDEMGEGYFETDIRGNFTVVNDAICRVLGYPREEMIGTNYRVFVAKEYVDAIYQALSQVYRTGMPLRQFTWEALGKDGGRKFIEASIWRLQDQEGKIIGFRGVGRDITGNKKSEAEYQTIIRTAMDGFWLTDMRGHFLDVNEAYCSLTGYSRDELLNMSIPDIEAIEKPEDVARRIRKLKRVGHDRFETRHRRKDGEIVDVEVSINYLSTDGGRYFVFVRDITERKQAEKMLKEGARRLQEAQALGRFGDWAFDLNTQRIEWSDEVYRLYERDKALGPPSAEEEALYYSPEEGEKLREFARLAVETGEEFKYDVTAQLPSGRMPYFSCTMRPIKDNEGHIIRLFGTVQDITERKRAEEALANEATRRRILIDQSRDGIVVLDENGKVYEVNQRFAEMLGYSAEEARELNVWDWEFLYPREQVQEMLRAVDEKGDHFETRHRRKDGTTYDVEISTNGAIIGGQKLIFCVCRDITERKQAEEALRLSEQNLRDSVENSPLGIRVLNKEGKTLYANRALLDFWGYNSVEEFEAVPVKQRYTPEGYAEYMKIMKKRKQGEDGLLNYEVGIVRSDDQVKHLSATTRALLWNGEWQFQVVYQDITERKQAEEALAKSEERYRSVLEQMEEAYYEVDIAGNFTFFNDATCRQLGYSREELMGMNYRVYTFKDDVQHVYEAFNQVYRTGKSYKGLPVVRIRKDGSRLSTETSAFPLRNERGDIIGFRGIASDVTEHKQAEDMLRESQERYRLLADNIKDAIWLMDLELNFLWFSPSCERLRGFTIEEMKAMPLDRHVTPESFQRAWDMYVKCMGDEKQGNLDPSRFYEGEFEFFRKDGSTFWADCKMSFMRDENGKATAMLFEGIDITERKQAEEALANEATRRRTLFDQSRDGVVVLDEDASVVEANQRFAEMLGYSPEEVLKLHTWDWDTQWTREELLEMGRSVDEAGAHLETQHRRKDGTVFDVEISVNKVTVGGQRLIFCVDRDVTERKQAEEKIKRLYSLQTAIRYINESLLKVNDERALFKRVCRFLKDIEFIRFCWIGLVDKESLKVKPVAYSGFEDGYLSALKINLDSSAYTRGPIGVAVKTRQPCAIADIENDPRFAPRREEALKRGYASSLAVPLIHDTEVIGVLSVYSGIKGAFGDAEVDFLAEAASDIALGIRTLRLRRELQESLDSLGKALEGTVSALASVAEVRDPYTSGHQQRVTRLAVAIANEMGLPQEQIKGIQVAGTLHDVGKLYIPAEILSKPGRLSEVEFSLVKMHSQAGYDILKTVKFPWPIAPIVLQHHERLDGSGYPQGLKGEDILLEAKILAVADVVEAMASHRPYRPALGIGQALDEISQKSGILYDSKVVDACFRLFYDKEFKLD